MKKTIIFLLPLLFSVGLQAQSEKRSPYQKKAMSVERFALPVNTGINHTLLILGSAWDVSPEIGDEIAVYDSDNNMVSSIAWRPEQEGHSGLAIWGDDISTVEKEGMVAAEPFSIVLFDKSDNSINKLKVNQWDVGNNIFVKDGVSVISSISTEHFVANNLELFQNVPNPTSKNTSITFYLPESGKLRLIILNSLGQEIMTLADSNFDIGTHAIQLDVTSLSAGSYFYKLETSNQNLTKQLTVLN